MRTNNFQKAQLDMSDKVTMRNVSKSQCIHMNSFVTRQQAQNQCENPVQKQAVKWTFNIVLYLISVLYSNYQGFLISWTLSLQASIL